jgi:hypothetical protein
MTHPPNLSECIQKPAAFGRKKYCTTSIHMFRAHRWASDRLFRSCLDRWPVPSVPGLCDLIISGLIRYFLIIPEFPVLVLALVIGVGDL